MSVWVRQLFVGLCLFWGSLSHAGEFWFYEWQDPPYATRGSAVAAPPVHTHPHATQPHDKHWMVTEFADDPYESQLKALQGVKGFQKVSVLFKKPVAPTLDELYVALSRAWKSGGVEGQFKFIGSLPTEQETQILKSVCSLGTKVFFVINVLPTASEAKNLVSLGDCVRIDFVLGRYLRWKDLQDLKRLPGVGLTMLNNYYPTFQHVDLLNMIDNPVGLRVTELLPTSEQLALVLQIKRLTGLTIDFDGFPTSQQYEVLSKLPAKSLSLRWSFGTPRASDIDSWDQLKLNRLQIAADVLKEQGIESRLRNLEGEIIVETFPLSKRFNPEF